jgi:membrane associated rhomboid family serine protease
MFILPIEIDNPIRHKPLLLFTVIGLNVLIYLMMLPSTLSSANSPLFRIYGFTPAHPGLLTVLSSMFIHSGLFHILGNMFFLWMFGDNIEDVIGHFFFIVCFMICGASATTLFYLLHPSMSAPLVGASGAISGIVGMYMVFFPKVRFELCFFVLRYQVASIRAPCYVAILFWFLEQFVLALSAEVGAISSYFDTAYSAHVGGLIMGVILGIAFRVLGFIDRYNTKKRRHNVLGYI